MIDKLLSGIPLDDIFIFDCHMHFGINGYTYSGGADAGTIVRTMDKMGVNMGCISSNMAIHSDCMTGNDEVADLLAKYPQQFCGYISLNPHYDLHGEILRCFAKNRRFLGIKIHAMYKNYPIDGEKFNEAYECADKAGIPVLIHTWVRSEVEEAANVARKYRNAKIIIAHAGFTDYEAREAAIAAYKKYDNVFLDTAISSTYDGSLEWLLAKTGSEKILYGSDTVFFDSRQTFGRIALSNVSYEDKVKIFGRNARAVFGV